MSTRVLQIVCGLTIAATSAWAQHGGGGEDDPRIPRQFVVQLTRESDDIFWIAQRYDATVVQGYPQKGLYLLQAQGEDDDDVIDIEMSGDHNIHSHERNERNVLSGGNTRSFFVRAQDASAYQNGSISRQMGVNAAMNYASGDGVMVAVLDTGIGSHDAFDGKVVPGGFNFVDNNGDVSDVATGVDTNGNGVPDQLVGHGTFVSGLVLLTAPNARILPIKVLDADGVGNTFTIAAGIYYAAAQHANIINLSLSSTTPSQIIANAIAEVRSASDVVVVAAVANDGSAAPSYPAAFPGVVSVAAIDAANNRAGFSNYGSYVMLGAPGVSLTSTLPDGTYGMASGTSFSAALVSGVAALVESRWLHMSADAMNLRLARTSIPLPLDTLTGQPYGRGRVNAVGAVLNVAPTPPTVRATQAN